MDNQTNLYQEAAFDAAKKMKFVKLKRLLETNENFDINICDGYNESLLTMLIGYPIFLDAQSVAPFFRSLLEHGIDINMKNSYGLNAMMLALRRSSNKVEKMLWNTLLDFGIDINAVDKENNNALMLSLRNFGTDDENNQICKELIANGIDYGTINHRREDALIVASDESKVKCIRLMMYRQPNPLIERLHRDAIMNAIKQNVDNQRLLHAKEDERFTKEEERFTNPLNFYKTKKVNSAIVCLILFCFGLFFCWLKR